ENMKASKLLQAWLKRLNGRGACIVQERECLDFERDSASGRIRLRLAGAGANADGEAPPALDAVCFCLGGGSHEPPATPLRSPRMFRDKGLAFTELRPSNVGYQVAWSAAFLKEAEGLPLKSFVLSSSRGSRKGEAVITRYGIEGTPVYAVGETGTLHL